MRHTLVYTCDFAVPRLGSVMNLFRSSPTRSYPLFHALLFSHMPARSSPGHLAKSVSPSTQFYLVNSYASLRAQLKSRRLCTLFPCYSQTLGIASCTENSLVSLPLALRCLGSTGTEAWSVPPFTPPLSFRSVSSQPGSGPAQRREQKHLVYSWSSSWLL